MTLPPWLSRQGALTDVLIQYRPRNKLTLKMKIGDEEIAEQGELFSEATFITALE